MQLYLMLYRKYIFCQVGQSEGHHKSNENKLQLNAIAPIDTLKCIVPHREVAFSDWIAVFATSFNSLLLLWSNGISYILVRIGRNATVF